jgi:glutamate/tyrosine decarboxylase-like PLP-dependent enzyme
MSAPYLVLLQSLQKAFPQPVSDPVHDGYVAFSMLRALDKIDALKSRTPILGNPSEPDYVAANASRIAEQGETLEALLPKLVEYLDGMHIWGHPRSQVNVVPNPTLASIIGVLLPLLYNPNLVSEESGRLFSAAEVRVAAMTAAIIGYDPHESQGVFTFGGSGTLLYGLKLGIEKALPSHGQKGLRDRAMILASDVSHYSVRTAADWLGIGQENVLAAPTHPDNSMDLTKLAQSAREILRQGIPLAGIVATMGTTDAFGLDDLAAIHALRESLVDEFHLPYRPHIHADAVIGWAWSMFNDYPFAENPLGFPPGAVHALAAAQHRIRHLHLADSVGIDFHKTGYVPYVASLFLVKQRSDFGLLARQKSQMPYLYQSGEYHPGMFTLETTRSACGPMAALGSMLQLGTRGYQTLLGHAVEMSQTLRQLIGAQPHLSVLNDENVGPVTLFRVFPDEVDTLTFKREQWTDPSLDAQVMAHNEYNRRVFAHVNEEALAGRGVAISLTDCYRRTVKGTPVVGLKSYVLSPFAQRSRMESILRHVLSAKDVVNQSWT